MFACSNGALMKNLKKELRKLTEGKKRKRIYYKNQRLRKDFYNYFDICRMEGIPESRAKNAVCEKGVEGIKNLPELEPIEHLFGVFERAIKGRMLNTYGIKRSYYDEWKLTEEVPQPPQGQPIRPNQAYLKVTIPKILKDELTRVIEKSNSISMTKVTQSDVVVVAIREYIDRRIHLIADDE